MLFHNNKLFNSIACLLSFTNLQLVIPGRTWILLYLGRTVYKRLWACLALYLQIDLWNWCFMKSLHYLPKSHFLNDSLYLKEDTIFVVTNYFITPRKIQKYIVHP